MEPNVVDLVTHLIIYIRLFGTLLHLCILIISQEYLKTWKTIEERYEHRGIYYLGKASPIACVAASPLQIHSRLGHVSLSKLKLLAPNLASLKTLECESCHLGKH
ncbi:unnamed protein product [Spirodela intermedia]|uniref:GAG-pre-integrase domain-containing protein n=2 Tax=Spirodela intermedia TaxID=51605 RepID=A0A7I8INV9_SPIIN|nr:unnamed protein product [Spirodela intermedia]CAA6659153.1 unnamed protein product [Spirodela intermedia]CAA7395458.1 unnamed protein product [Spirodela intermedia]